MKGIIFTEFLDMVEKKFSIETVDQIIESSSLASGGSYTSVGTYPHTEMAELVINLGKETGIPVKDLLIAFGNYLFNRLTILYPNFVVFENGLLFFLESIENHIHIEVRKLYSDADLPTFRVVEKSTKKLTIIYNSSKGLTYFAIGLIKETLNHFKVNGTVSIDKSFDPTMGVKFIIELD
jgi:hypothetical protein